MNMSVKTISPDNFSPDNFASQEFSAQIKRWGLELGFQSIGITDTDLSVAKLRLETWLQQKMHGEMAYMQHHGDKRSQPEKLIPGTIRIISARMNYLPGANAASIEKLDDGTAAYISRYALGRDYHKLMRKRLQKLAEKIKQQAGHLSYRVFVDSAPVLEKEIAAKSGQGWIGKHSNLLCREEGSWFFLGEIYVDLPLVIDQAVENHCGTCSKCLDVCPTKAIIAPYIVDARRCISYLTIELKGAIPKEFRKQIGNRIYGCDDCQLFCPWNRFANLTQEQDFLPRHQLDDLSAIEGFQWTEEEFLSKTEGSAIRRIGYERWLRNIAVALGNANTTPELINVLIARLNDPSNLVIEHVLWALTQHDVHPPG